MCGTLRIDLEARFYIVHPHVFDKRGYVLILGLSLNFGE